MKSRQTNNFSFHFAENVNTYLSMMVKWKSGRKKLILPLLRECEHDAKWKAGRQKTSPFTAQIMWAGTLAWCQNENQADKKLVLSLLRECEHVPQHDAKMKSRETNNLSFHFAENVSTYLSMMVIWKAGRQKTRPFTYQRMWACTLAW